MIDLGHAREVRRQAQNGADAAALAGGNSLYLHGSGTPDFVAAVAAAKNYALMNFGITNPGMGHLHGPVEVERPTRRCAPVRLLRPAGAPDHGSRPAPGDPGRHLLLSKIIGVRRSMSGRRAHSQFHPQPPRSVACASSAPAFTTSRTATPPSPAGDIHFNGSVSVSNNGLVSTTR